MIPTDRKSFIQYCLRTLGADVNQINVSPAQIEDRVDQALFKFYESHMEATYEQWVTWKITEQETIQKYIQLPDDVIAVTQVMRPNMSGGVWSVDYQFFMNELYTTSSLYQFGDVSYYIMSKMHIDLLNRYFSPDRSWSYNKINQQLIIAGGLKNAWTMEGGLVLCLHRKLHGEARADDPSGTVIYNIWQNQWLQNYVTALIKKQWAVNMSKFKNIQLLGGITLDAADLLLEAKQEISDLDDELNTKYQLPIDFFVA